MGECEEQDVAKLYLDLHHESLQLSRFPLRSRITVWAIRSLRFAMCSASMEVELRASTRLGFLPKWKP